MSEREYILSKLDEIGRATFLATENWHVNDWKKIRNKEYYLNMSNMGASSREFRKYKLNKILKA